MTEILSIEIKGLEEFNQTIDKFTKSVEKLNESGVKSVNVQGLDEFNKAIDRLNKHRIGAKRITIYLSWRNMTTKKRGTFKVNSPLAIPTRDYKYWTCIALDLWKKLPDLQINDIPLLVGLRFTRTLDSNDINLQLFDLSWNSDYVYEEKYKLPDRISFGDPGRMFEE